MWYVGCGRRDGRANRDSSALGKRSCGIMAKIALSDACAGPKGHHLCARTKRDGARGAVVGFSAVGSWRWGFCAWNGDGARVQVSPP